VATAQEIFAQHRPLLGTIPPYGQSYVCEICLGPVTSYDRCYACNQVFVNGGVPSPLWDRVVPMTSVLNPSPWYGILSTYKRGQAEQGRVLVALAYLYLEQHRDRLAALLGGPPTMLTIVPSKRGLTFETQPFRQQLARIDVLAKQLRHTLVHRAGEAVDRWTYRPAAFAPGPVGVKGERVLLLEDAWVTGATAVSAAGALLGFGAASVVVVPLARVVDGGFWDGTHPYRVAMATQYEMAAWPRG
jgi:predicted amidophosphoribosyltransferase